jgi:hypothetical protein
MVQDQLVEYISSQLKLGVSRDAVRTALLAAGWAAGDVDDTLKKVENGSGTKPAATASPAASGGAGKSAEPQTIRVSDLISASVGAPQTGVSPGGAARAKAVAEKAVGKDAGEKKSMFARFKGSIPSGAGKQKVAGVNTGMSAVVTAGRSRHIVMIVGIVVILALGGLAGYLYFQNNNLAAKVASLAGESAGVTTQIATLNGNITALNTSNTALAAQVNSLMAENANLLLNLSFVAVPTASTTGAGTPAAENVSVNGMLTKVKTSYVLTTQYGVAVYVKNSSDAAVAAALKPLVDSTSTVTLAGTHVPGSAYLTVTSVNGSAVQSQSPPPGP